MRSRFLTITARFLPAMLLLAACGSAPTQTAPSTPQATTSETAKQTADQAKAAVSQAQAGGTLVIVSDQKPSHLDPNLHSSRFTAMINMNTHDPLIWQPEPNKFVSGLAEKWEVSADQTTFTFHLRKDVKFHDGTPLNAEAVKQTWDRIVDPKTRALQVTNFANLDKYEVVDPYTIQIKFKVPNPRFLNAASVTTIAVQSPTAIQKLGDKYIMTPVGTGPFKVEGWPNENTLVLVKNPDYKWGPETLGRTGPAYIDKVVYKFVTEESTRSAALEKQEASVVENAARSLNPQYRSDPRYQVLTFKTSGIPQYWSFNVTRYPTNDLAVRQAFEYAIDKQKIADVAFFGTVTPGKGPLTDTNWAFWPDAKNYYPYDPKKAVQLLEQAGYTRNATTQIFEKDGKPVRIRLVTSSTNDQMRSAEMAQQMLKDVGIDLVVEGMVYDATVPRYANNDYEMGRLGLSGFDPDVLWLAFHSSQIKGGSQFNRTRIESKELDAMLDKGRSLSDPTERKQLYGQIQKQILDNAYGIFLWEDHYYWVGQSCVKGWAWDPSGSYMMHNVWLEGACRNIKE
jgi:peptide/nickel transport system substrate-binding protein